MFNQLFVIVTIVREILNPLNMQKSKNFFEDFCIIQYRKIKFDGKKYN